MTDKPPAFDGVTSEKILRDNLNALYANRTAFTASESSEKIRRALNHNVRTSSDIKYFTGDKVYYKRLGKIKWKGPGVVLGQDGQQVLVKHGGIYVRVHPCRLMLVNSDCSSNKQETSTAINNESRQDKDSHHSYDENSQSSSDEGFDSAENDDAQKEIEIEPPLPSGVLSNNQNNTNDTAQKKITLKKGMHVRYKTKDDGDNWYSAKLISRSGKATGKYKNEWNVENDEDGKHVV